MNTERDEIRMTRATVLANVDALIAATAQAYTLTVITLNAKHFPT